MTSVIPADDILKAFSELQLGTYFFMSGTAFLVADWFFTLDLEAQYAWNGTWNIGRTLFFLTRYSPFLELGLRMYYEVVHSIPVSLCSQLYIISASMSLFGIIVAELILVTRVWALWERRRDIGTLLALFTIADASAAILTYALYAPSYSFILMDTISPTTAGCFLVSDGATTNWAYVALLVQQTVIFTLTAVKGVQHYLTGGFGTSLLKTLYQDGLMYYVILIVPSIVTLSVTFPTTNASSTGFLLPIQRVLHSALSARMLLHLRYEVDRLQRNTLGSVNFQFKGAESSSSSPPRRDASQIQPGPHDDWFGPTR